MRNPVAPPARATRASFHTFFSDKRSLRRCLAPLASLALCAGLALGCNSPSTSAPSPSVPTVAPPPPTNRTLAPADPRESQLAKGIAELLKAQHLTGQTFDDALSQKAFAEFLRRLDPGKSYLLKSHVAELRAYAEQMDDQLLSGDLLLSRLAQAIMAERQGVVAKLVAAQLGKPFDFTIDETLELDPEKYDFSATEEEFADRWRRSLKQQALERVARMDKLHDALSEALGKAKTADEKALTKKALAKVPTTDEARRDKVRTDLAKHYDALYSRLSKPEPLESTDAFLNAVTSVYDPHTVYLAPAEQENFDIQMSGKLEGIGAVLQENDHFIKVVEIVPGGASSRQGKLKSGDLILAVAQQGEEPIDITDMRINMVVKMIRGKAGSVVTLTVKKPDDRIEILPITRDVVEVEASYARGALLKRGNGVEPVGLIYLPSFYGSTKSRDASQRNATDDVRKLLADMQSRNTSGLIIDLRGNGGGFLDQARDISGMFIDLGPIVQTKYATGKPEVLRDKDPSVVYKGAVVVLVDRFSASASEIVAAALQDYGRAVVVGTTTHGKGTVQVLLDLSRMASNPEKPLGILKLTIQQFFRIQGGSTQFRGVVPDVSLPDPAAHVESGERFLDHAIGWSEVDGLSFKKLPHSWNSSDLASRSAARVAANPIFAKFSKLSDLAKGRRAQTEVPLKRETWKARRDADEKSLEAADPKLADRNEQFKVTVINEDTGKGAGKNDRIENWRKNIARDPWVGEAVNILGDMAAPLKSVDRNKR